MTEGQMVRYFYFVDEDPFDKPLSEFRLMYGQDIDDKDRFRVYQCTDPTNIPEDSVLAVLEIGDAVGVTDSKFHQAIVCQLMTLDEFHSALENHEEEDLDYADFLNVPEELTGVDIPAGAELTENQLAWLAMSLNFSRMTDDEGNINPEYQRLSIWQKLGRMSKKLFSFSRRD